MRSTAATHEQVLEISSNLLLLDQNLGEESEVIPHKPEAKLTFTDFY